MLLALAIDQETGTVFFTRNGKKLEDVAHGLKSQNFFPTVGATGPCNVHVNFGQMGFVFLEANVKKWGLAPMTGSLAPPPPYGSEQGSILLEGGREGQVYGHSHSASAQLRLARGPSTRSPGPQRSPTDISLAQFNLMDADEDAGEGTSEGRVADYISAQPRDHVIDMGLPFEPADHPPPDYESPVDESDESTPRASRASDRSEDRRRLLGQTSPPIPTYEAATNDSSRGRSATRCLARSHDYAKAKNYAMACQGRQRRPLEIKQASMTAGSIPARRDEKL
ncbi:hypothetical protein MRB53_038958 [Persea americana]|nr:hypothetical protein MRB53_038958 [Persea americana]